MKKIQELLINRAKSTNDKRIIGLVLPGGGMTGVFGGGVMQVLEELGLADSFDYIYSGSSGSCSGSYLLSKKTKIGTSIYSEDLSEKKFLKLRLTGNIMDLDYFCDDIMQKKSLNLERIKNSNTILKIFVTDANNGNMEYFTNKDSVNFMSLIKATCSYPGLYYPLVKINGKQYLDGTVMNLFPIKEIMKDGCTDIISVATFPKTHRFSDFEWLRILSRHLCGNLGKEYKNKYKHQTKKINESLDIMFGVKKINAKPNIYIILPDYYLSPSETNKDKLEEFEKHGIKKAKEFFSE